MPNPTAAGNWQLATNKQPQGAGQQLQTTTNRQPASSHEHQQWARSKNCKA